MKTPRNTLPRLLIGLALLLLAAPVFPATYTNRGIAVAQDTAGHRFLPAPSVRVGTNNLDFEIDGTTVNTPIDLGTGTSFVLDPAYSFYKCTASGDFTISLGTNSVTAGKGRLIQLKVYDAAGSKTATLSSSGTGGSAFTSPVFEGFWGTNSPTAGTNTYYFEWDWVWHDYQNTALISAKQLGQSSDDALTTTGSPTFGTTTTAIKQKGPLYDITAYGADSTGVTNCATTVQSVIDAAAAAGGGTVLFPAGTFKIDSGLTNGSNIAFEFLPGAVIDATGVSSSTTLFRASGSQASGVLLTADAPQGGTSVSVSAGAEAAFAVGDWVKIGATNYWTPNTTADSSMDQRIGEIARVASTSSGSITLQTLLQDSYTTANLAFIAKLTPVENISFNGPVRIIGKGTGSSVAGILVDVGVRVRISGLRLDNFDECSVRMFDVVDSKISGITVFGGTSAASTFYGVNYDGACQDSTCESSFFNSCRHAITFGGTSSRSGINRRITVQNNKSVSATASSFDTHAGADQISFIGNVSVGPAGHGYNLRSPSVVLIGNRSINAGSSQSGIYFRNQSYKPTRYTAQGNVILNSGGSGIQYSVPTESVLAGTSAGQLTDGVTLVGNQIISPTGIAFNIWSTASFSLTNLVVSDNIVKSCQPTSSRMFFLSNVVNSTFANNVGTDIGSTTDAYRLVNCSYLTFNGGLSQWEVAPTAEFGFQGVASTNISVTGMTIQNATRPASLDSACVNWVFSSVATPGCNDYSLSSGANNTAPILGGRTWAIGSAMTPYVGSVDYFTDVGIGSHCSYVGSRWKPVNGRAVLKSLGAAVSGVTNSYSQVMQTLLPSNSLKANDTIRVYLALNKSGTTDTGQVFIGIGTAGTTGDAGILNATGLMAASARTWAGFIDIKIVDDTTAQKVGGSTTVSTGVGTSTTVAASGTAISSISANALYVTVFIRSSSTNDTVGIDNGSIEWITP